METLVSIIIRTYNNKMTILRCIESALSQEFNNIELIGVITSGGNNLTRAFVA